MPSGSNSAGSCPVKRQFSQTRDSDCLIWSAGGAKAGNSPAGHVWRGPARAKAPVCRPQMKAQHLNRIWNPAFRLSLSRKHC